MKQRLLTVLTLVVVTFTTAQAARSQSLAAAAKQEQERRKKTASTGPKKVYTESDIKAPPTSASDPTSGAATPEAPSAAGSQSGTKRGSKQPTPEEMKAIMTEAWKAREANLKAQIAQAEETAKRLGSHPTGGGKVCKVDEGSFQPGVTAPEQVVCPAQMETRYEVAKRELDKLKAEFAAAEEQARRAGLIR